MIVLASPPLGLKFVVPISRLACKCNQWPLNQLYFKAAQWSTSITFFNLIYHLILLRFRSFESNGFIFHLNCPPASVFFLQFLLRAFGVLFSCYFHRSEAICPLVKGQEHWALSNFGGPPAGIKVWSIVLRKTFPNSFFFFFFQMFASTDKEWKMRWKNYT